MFVGMPMHINVYSEDASDSPQYQGTPVSLFVEYIKFQTTTSELPHGRGFVVDFLKDSNNDPADFVFEKNNAVSGHTIQ